MSLQDADETINNLLLRNLQKSKEHNNQSDFYDYNPLTSTYKCYGCQKQKPISCQLIKKKRKRRVLDTYKMNDVIIKPWHPFLREFQKIFKNSITQKQGYQQEYHKPDYVLQLYEAIRRLREQLLQNVKILQQMNHSITPTMDTLATYSIDEMELNYEGGNTSTRSTHQDSLKRSSVSQNSVRYQLQEKKIQHYKEQLEIVKEEVQLLEQGSSISLKQQIQATIKAQKENQFLAVQLKEAQDHLYILEREFESLQRENYFLYQYAQLDRHSLFIKIMEQYQPDLLRETDVSLFDIYLQEQEKELAKAKLEKTKLQLITSQYEKKTDELQKEQSSQFSSEFKIYEQKWSSEKSSLEKNLERLKQELDISQRAENELRQINRSLQKELDGVKQQLFDCQNGMNNISHQHLLQRQQNEQLIKQNQDLQQTIKQLEVKVVENRGSLATMNASDQAQQLALIILSKERPNDDQIGLLQKVFGKYTDQVIQNQMESKQAEKLLEQINDLRNLKEKLEQQLLQSNKQIEEIKQEVGQVIKGEQQSSSSKIGRKLNFDSDDSNPHLVVLQRINEILNNRGDEAQKQSRFKSQNPYAKKLEQDSNYTYLLLLQALTLEEMVKSNEEVENFSDADETKDKQWEDQNKQSFIPIDEQECEDSSNDGEEIEESSIHQPEPYQDDDLKKA